MCASGICRPFTRQSHTHTVPMSHTHTQCQCHTHTVPVSHAHTHTHTHTHNTTHGVGPGSVGKQRPGVIMQSAQGSVHDHKPNVRGVMQSAQGSIILAHAAQAASAHAAVCDFNKHKSTIQCIHCIVGMVWVLYSPNMVVSNSVQLMGPLCKLISTGCILSMHEQHQCLTESY